MTSPYAKGLFDKGIVQSGATETMGVQFNTYISSTRLAQNVLSLLGISADNIEDIQKVSAEGIRAASSQALQQTGRSFKSLLRWETLIPWTGSLLWTAISFRPIP